MGLSKEEKAKTREKCLSDLWRKTGIGSDDPSIQEGRIAALHELASALETCDIILQIRATQALFLSTETPSAYRRALLTPLWEAIDNSWRAAGGKTDHLAELQLLIQAIFTAEQDILVQPIKNYLRSLPSLPEDLKVEKDHTSVSNNEGDQHQRHTEVKTPSISQTLEAVKAANNLLLSAGGNVNIHSHQVANHLNAILDALEGTHKKNAAALLKLTSEINTALAQCYQAIDTVYKAGQEDSSQSKLLWWGQAKYSRLDKRSFRRMKDPLKAITLAAIEAANLSINLHSEAAAAYLEEVLHQLGHQLGESKALKTWLKDYSCVEALQEFPISDEIREACTEDSLAFPITWLCLNLGRNFEDSQLVDALGLDINQELDLGQWACWIFNEALFHLRVAEFARREVANVDA